MSKARIRRVRAERDELLAVVDKLRGDLSAARVELSEVRDVVGMWNPDTEDPTAKRDELWELLRW